MSRLSDPWDSKEGLQQGTGKAGHRDSGCFTVQDFIWKKDFVTPEKAFKSFISGKVGFEDFLPTEFAELCQREALCGLVPSYLGQPCCSFPPEWILNLAPATAFSLALFLLYLQSLLVTDLSASGLMSFLSLIHIASNNLSKTNETTSLPLFKILQRLSITPRVKFSAVASPWSSLTSRRCLITL